jgi:hypothetical protein
MISAIKNVTQTSADLTLETAVIAVKTAMKLSS